jgi:hypothetical protein
MLPDIINYIPDPQNGRPIANGRVYFLIDGYMPPMRDADLDQTKIAPVTANNITVPQPIYTSKGGTLIIGSQTNQPGVRVSTLVARAAVYDKCGKLVFSIVYNGFGADSATVISETAPNAPFEGMRWYKPSDPATYIYYIDVDGGQWVQESGAFDSFDSARVSSISQLRSTEAIYDDQILTVNAYYANGTTGGGDFQWDATSTAADDGGVTIAVAGVATGRWVRRLEGYITPEMYGALGNNANTNTDRNAWIAALASGNKLIFANPAGVYNWNGSNGPTIPSDVKVYGFGCSVVQTNFDAAATISVGNEYSGFRCNLGTSNVKVFEVKFIGPFGKSGTVTPAYRSIGFSISGRYDQYFYNNPFYPSNLPTPPTGENENIHILDCEFYGWGQSAVIADQITLFRALRNTIKNCARDGIRMYGCKDFWCDDNEIDTMAPGFPSEGIAPNFNVYGISATRVYQSHFSDGDTAEYRPSQSGFIRGNVVRNCPTWKALDTHGGFDIEFGSNIIYNAHIGIGIDKGGYNLTDGYAPPKNIRLTGRNVIIADPANPAGNRAGIFAVAHDNTTENIGRSLLIQSPIIQGYGQDTRDGQIVVSNYDTVTITDVDLSGGLRCGISLQQTVKNLQIRGGFIKDLSVTTLSFCVGINASSATIEGTVDGVTFDQSIVDAMTCFTGSTPSAGFGVKLGEVKRKGNTLIANSLTILDQSSPYLDRKLARASVSNAAGAVTFSFNSGFVSATHQSTGIVRLVLVDAPFATSTFMPKITPRTTSTIFSGINPIDATTFDIYTRNSAGALTDIGFHVEFTGA